jgi:hypothetical protein
MKLGIRSFGIAAAVMAFLFTFIIGLWYSSTGYGVHVIEIFSSFYSNIFKFAYNPLLPLFKNIQNNIIPVFLLSLFSLIDGFIAGSVFSFFYNFMQSREKK